MEFKFRNVVLRDMGEADIEDEIRWNTVETQWAQWDAPWESLEALKSFDPAAHRRTELEQLKKPKPEIRKHPGAGYGRWCPYRFGCFLFCGPGLQLDFKNPARADPVSCPWSGYQREPLLGKGLGTQALTAWILYFGEHGERELYLQTWSGNTRMIRCAMKLGFQEVCRKPGIRQVRGETWDGLTFA